MVSVEIDINIPLHLVLFLHHSTQLNQPIMKFTTVIVSAAAIAGVASAPVAEGEATLGLIKGILGGLLGHGSWGGSWGWNGQAGWGWGGNGGWGSSWYYRKVTVIKSKGGQTYYYCFPPNYNPCGCEADAAYAVTSDDANKLIDDASFAVETNDAVTIPDDVAEQGVAAAAQSS